MRRLAKAGRSGRSIDSPLTDEQVQALRDAFEHLDQDRSGEPWARCRPCSSVQVIHIRRKGSQDTWRESARQRVPAASNRSRADSLAVAAEQIAATRMAERPLREDPPLTSRSTRDRRPAVPSTVGGRDSATTPTAPTTDAAIRKRTPTGPARYVEGSPEARSSAMRERGCTTHSRTTTAQIFLQ